MLCCATLNSSRNMKLWLVREELSLAEVRNRE